MSDAASTSKLGASAPVTTVTVGKRRAVCYEFDTTASKAKELMLPYLIIIDGKVQNQDKQNKLDASRKIKLSATAGSKVALLLNSDIHPHYRCNPVYEVTVEDSDIRIKITEKNGRHGHLKPIVGIPTLRQLSSTGEPTACYEASMTGDIWMKISHRYSETEAITMMSPTTTPQVREAVCSIYRGLSAEKLSIPRATDQAKKQPPLTVYFQRSRNAEQNIVSCSFLGDVLPRTHPCAFEALFSAALQVGITEMLVTSAWRPMYGSIVHRAGLGLDVTSIRDENGEIQINRQGLLEPGYSHNPNISDSEKESLNNYNELEKKLQSKKDDRQLEDDVVKARRDWEKEVAGSQPKLMRELREHLRKHPMVKQIYDPWYMEGNTSTSNGKSANKQKSQNEVTHDNHLHLTMHEPKIL